MPVLRHSPPSLKSWRERKKAGDPDAKLPHKRKRFFRIEYKKPCHALLKTGTLRLSNGKGNAPLLLAWPWDLPQTVATPMDGHAVRGHRHLRSSHPSTGPFSTWEGGWGRPGRGAYGRRP